MYDLGNTEGARTIIPYKRGTRPMAGIGHNGGPVMVPDLSSEKARILHRSLLGHYMRELEVQQPWRTEKAMDEQFYDNEAWTEEEKAVLKARGQMATNLNVVATTINWMIGTERRGRTEFKVLPRKKTGSQAAERKSQLLKYLADANHSEFAMSQAYADAIKSGEGWIESGWQRDDEGEPVYDRVENWRNILRDSLSREMDYGDGRYQFRMKWADEDVAHATFPDGGMHIDMARTSNHSLAGSNDTFGDEWADEGEEKQNIFGSMSNSGFLASPRSRVRLIECWFRKPVQTDVLIGGQFSGEIFDADSDGHTTELDNGDANLETRVKMRMHVGIFTTAGLLHFQESPYRHNAFPLTPIWCYRKAGDGESYGLIRNIRPLQIQINHAASKAQHVLSTNKTIMDKGAVDDLDEFEEEVARPDAIIVKNAGKELTIDVDRELAASFVDLMSRYISMVQQVGGVTDENMGRTTNATSGKAITARQDQGGLATAEPLDNLAFARRLHGEKMLSLMEQFMTKEKQFRITNSRGVPEYVAINDGLPENDIVATKADYVITEQAYTATTRQAQFEATMEMIKMVAPVAPEFVLMVADLLIEQSDMPNREEIVKRIRQMTGAKDPDADPDAPMTPEEQAMEQQKAKEAAMQERAIVAKISLDEAGAAQKAAAAGKAAADTAAVAANQPSINLDQLQKAIEIAFQMLSVPAAAPVGDKILAGVGYVGAPSPTIPTGTLPGSSKPVPSGATPPFVGGKDAPLPGPNDPAGGSAPQPMPQIGA